ncbi:MAG TPA: PLP-dependent aminotransferase family protein [Chloroflexota bacterium]|nr:PLP-dependent aminotransferase family protein [Chloroflexota bacterium]
MSSPAATKRQFNFGAGNPDPGVFPAEALAEAAARIIPKMGKRLAVYPDGKGLPQLRELAAERFERAHGLKPPIDDIVITNGSMQGLVLTAQGLARPGDCVLTEEFQYSGTIRVYKLNGLDLVPVAQDDEGMRVELLDEVLAKHLDAGGKKPAFIYTTASYQNPTGTTMPLKRRQVLLEFARKHGMVIVDDDCYADVSFVPQMEPAIYKLASPGECVYLASFSKILGPGVRLGYYIAPPALMAKLQEWKTDGGISELSQMIVAEYLQEHMWEHIKEGTRAVKEKRDELLDSLEREFAGMPMSWTHPDGGLFMFVKLPESVDRPRLQQLAQERGILYGTGQAFHSQNADTPYLRLAFGWIDKNDIREGVHQLAECVKAAMPAGAAR